MTTGRGDCGHLPHPRHGQYDLAVPSRHPQAVAEEGQEPVIRSARCCCRRAIKGSHRRRIWSISWCAFIQREMTMGVTARGHCSRSSSWPCLRGRRVWHSQTPRARCPWCALSTQCTGTRRSWTQPPYPVLTCEPRVGMRGCHTNLGEFDWFLVDLGQSLDCIGVVAEILLAANEQEGRVGAEVAHLGHPFLRHVLERVGAVDGEADQQNVGVGVRQGAKTVVVLLACSDNHVSMCARACR